MAGEMRTASMKKSSAGFSFFFIRAGFALVPSLATQYPIKKWAAFGALIAAAFYLLLSGAEVATQRSFIMIAIVLTGVMLDRPASRWARCVGTSAIRWRVANEAAA